MLIVISPAKKLDETSSAQTKQYTVPELLDASEQLVKECKKLSAKDLSKLMGVSDKIAQLNETRFASFSTPFTPDNAKQAILTFKGDVYQGIDVDNYSEEEFSFLQNHLRILSGLYGLLRPLDLIQPYRLEMGTKLANPKGKDLYSFWGNTITDKLNDALDDNVVINLASNEYWHSIKPKEVNAHIVTPVFKEKKPGGYKVIGLSAKRARGMMTNYVVKNRIEKYEDLKHFSEAGYQFQPEMSSETEWVYTRD